jgi:cell division protein FtsB
MASDGVALIRRILLAAIVVGAATFAIQGGEFGTTDLFRQRREKARIGKSIDSLQRIVDSLKRYETAVLKDPATQERLAREVFGMVRGDKELLYRFADSARAGSRP